MRDSLPCLSLLSHSVCDIVCIFRPQKIDPLSGHSAHRGVYGRRAMRDEVSKFLYYLLYNFYILLAVHPNRMIVFFLET